MAKNDDYREDLDQDDNNDQATEDTDTSAENTEDEDFNQDFDPDDDYEPEAEDDDAEEPDDEADEDQTNNDETDDDEEEDDEDDYDFDFLDEDDDYEFEDWEDDDEDDWEDDEEETDDQDEDTDEDDDVDPEVRRLRRENAHRRIQNRELQETAAAAVEKGIADFSSELANQLGIDLDETGYNAESISQSVREKIEQEREQAQKAKRDLAIYRAASSAGANFDKLADSKTFTRAIEELDPNDDEYVEKITGLVRKAVESNPEWKKPATVKRSGGDFTNTAPTVEGDSVEALQKRRRARRLNQ